MQFGRISGIEKPVARIVLGTMIVSDEERKREDSFALLDAALAEGGNTLDTAHVYGGGHSERGIGLCMEARGNREDMVIISKGCHHNADRKRVSAHDLGSDLADSLARLRTDYVDAYLLHRDDPDVPVAHIVDALNEHHHAGRIRAFGGSNWRHERIAEANEYAVSHGLVGFTLSSPNYGLADQVRDPWGPGCVSLSGPRKEAARAWYIETGMPILAYSSLGRGLFSGRVDPDDADAAETILDRAACHAYLHPENLERLRRARSFAQSRGCSIPQIALAYVLSSPLNVFPLVGAASGPEFEENVAALDLSLTAQERDWLDLRVESL